MSYSFREKVLDSKHRVFIFEAVPPEPHINEKSLKTRAQTLAMTLNGFKEVDAICIPHVIDESDRGSKITRNVKVDAREFGYHVRRMQRKSVIVTYPFSYIPKTETADWLRRTYNIGKIDNLVVVGPSRNHTDLPGYSVEETAKLIGEMNSKNETDIFQGAICIDSRRKKTSPHLPMDEPERMARKARAGTQYFLNQISYDPESILNLLRDYRNESAEREEQPRRVILSVSPISSINTLAVIEGLIEKKIDEDLRCYVLKFSHGIAERSEQRIEEMFRRIFEDYYTENISVPIGICVEYVTRTNFEPSLDLLHRLPKIWKEYQPESRFSANNRH